MKLIGIIVAFLLISASIHAGELETRETLKRKVLSLINQNDIEALESMANEFRTKESRTESGLWKLTIFYKAFDRIGPTNKNDEAGWERLLKQMDAWILKYPNSPTPRIIKGLIQKTRGWNIRGRGYSNTVKKEAWKPFFKKLEEARAYLVENQSISKNDPHWYVAMSEVAKAQSWSESRYMQLMNEGLSNHPYYYQLHFAIMNYLTPKWHGNAKKIESFAHSSLERTKEKEGYALYARIYWAASQSQFQGRLIEKSDINWKTMSIGIDDVLSKYPDQWNINNFALLSCAAKDKTKTRELIGKITGNPIKSAWLDDIKNYHSCKKWSAK